VVCWITICKELTDIWLSSVDNVRSRAIILVQLLTLSFHFSYRCSHLMWIVWLSTFSSLFFIKWLFHPSQGLDSIVWSLHMPCFSLAMMFSMHLSSLSLLNLPCIFITHQVCESVNVLLNKRNKDLYLLIFLDWNKSFYFTFSGNY